MPLTYYQWGDQRNKAAHNFGTGGGQPVALKRGRDERRGGEERVSNRTTRESLWEGKEPKSRDGGPDCRNDNNARAQIEDQEII